MSRDFLIECNNSAEASALQVILESVKVTDGLQVFTVDNRGESLFIELTYDNDIKKGTILAGTNIDLSEYVSFVAIKNGEHDAIGYMSDTNKKYSEEISMPVTQVFSEIINAM